MRLGTENRDYGVRSCWPSFIIIYFPNRKRPSWGRHSPSGRAVYSGQSFQGFNSRTVSSFYLKTCGHTEESTDYTEVFYSALLMKDRSKGLTDVYCIEMEMGRPLFTIHIRQTKLCASRHEAVSWRRKQSLLRSRPFHSLRSYCCYFWISCLKLIN